MTGPEHSKKPKTVTIDLEPDAVHEVKADAMANVMPENVEEGPEKDVFEAASPDEPSSPTQVASKSSGGLLGKLGAGIFGGLIALTGAAGLQYAGQLPSFGSGAEIAALKAEVAKLSSAPSIDPTMLDGLTKAHSDLSSLVAALSADMEAVKSGTASVDAATLLTMQEKLTSLENALSTAQVSGAPVDPASTAAFKALAEKVAALEARPVDNGGSSSVAMAIAASGLKAAIDRGGSFMNELETYASVVPSSPDVEALRVLAAKGVPSQQELLVGFGDAANAMITASIVPDPDMGILQRLTESAKGLVKARRVGDIQGDEPDAVIARMEVALQKGDLETVIALSEKLPEASKAAGKVFLDQVLARRDTDTLVTRALSLALSQTGGKS